MKLAAVAELRRKNRTAYVRTTVAIGSTNADQIGDDIPDDKVRHIWRMIISNPGAAIQQLGIFQADATDEERTMLGRPDIRITGGPFEIGGNIENPILTLRPNTGPAVTQGNQLRLNHETDALDITIDYYDE